MMNSMKSLNRRRFGKLLGLAGTAGVAAVTGTPVAAQGAAQWKDWVAKFYKKPVKIAVSCAGTTNP
jgi:hypothetical protein